MNSRGLNEKSLSFNCGGIKARSVNIGINIFFLQADTWHLIIITIKLIIVINVFQIKAK